MNQFLNFLSFLVSAYMLALIIRIILTWFTGVGGGGFQNFLSGITDPYLNWFRRFPILRAGALDLSPVAALGALSLVNRVFSTLARYGSISIGILLALALQVAWGAVSFFLGFLIIILIAHLITHFMGLESRSPFVSVINTISQSVLYRINNAVFKDRILDHRVSMFLAIGSLGIFYLVLKILVTVITGILVRLPV